MEPMDNTNAGTTTTTTKHKNVFTVVETKQGRGVWVKIGAAFPNRDGSLTVRLDALPLNGQLQVRDPAAWEERERRPDGAGNETGPRGVREAFA